MLKLRSMLVWMLGLCPCLAQAPLTLASLLTDHAVLQRDMPVPIWGTADRGATVAVLFADQEQKATADANGRWRVQLNAMPGSLQPRTLTVRSPGQPTITRRDLVVGEVWICSGQSNMQMSRDRVPQAKELLPKAKNIRAFEVPRTCAFKEQESCQGTWSLRPPTSAVAFTFAYFLEQHAGWPIGIIHASWGSSSIEAWMPRDMTKTLPHFDRLMSRFDTETEHRQKIAGMLDGSVRWNDIFMRKQPNLLYNAMIHPLAPYACRGVVWYQGERNTKPAIGPKTPWLEHNATMRTYGASLKAWIQRYRKLWSREDLHFLVVMLPGYAKNVRKRAADPAAKSWAWMRESQLQALELPHTAVANTIDLGHITNIHPTDKLPIGRRLALLAARETLASKAIAQGPLMRRVEQLDDGLVVHFDHAKGLRTNDGKPPQSFWLADESGSWLPAEAEIRGETVRLRSPKLPLPRYARYAFAGKPTVNLVNAAGLPAYPFRTDRFELGQ
ncbi:MAG: sialate O-acetylesterase [Planctomycetota bacterium]